MSHTHDHPENGAHILPISFYTKTLILLAILMGATIAAAKLPIPSTIVPNLWVANLIALGIAVTKATLVVRNFMHYKFSTPVVKWWTLLGFAWLIVLGLVLVDYQFRQYEPVPGFDPSDPAGSSLQRHEETKQSDNPMMKNFRPRNPAF